MKAVSVFYDRNGSLQLSWHIKEQLRLHFLLSYTLAASLQVSVPAFLAGGGELSDAGLHAASLWSVSTSTGSMLMSDFFSLLYPYWLYYIRMVLCILFLHFFLTEASFALIALAVNLKPTTSASLSAHYTTNVSFSEC